MTEERVPYQLTPPTADNQPPKLLKDQITEWLKTNNTVLYEVQDGTSDPDRLAREIIESFLATTKLAPALDGEPVFVLRAQDKTAPLAVFMWAEEATQRGAHAKADGARQIASEMLAWQYANPTRVKNPD